MDTDDDDDSTQNNKSIDEILMQITDKLTQHDDRIDAVEKRQTDHILIEMEEIAKYVENSMIKLDGIAPERVLFEIKQIQKTKGDGHGFISAFEQLQKAGMYAQMTKVVLFAIINVMNKIEHKMIYDEETRAKERKASEQKH